MATFWRSYLHVLSKHPWKTQLATTGVLCGAGDCIAQLIVEKKELRHYDWIRCTRFTLVGFCVIGPALRTWYLALERLFGTTGKSVALKKVFFDQTIFAPIFLGNFIMLMSHLQGQKWPDIKNTMEKDYTSVLLTNYKNSSGKCCRLGLEHLSCLEG
ncbi:PREDICTED: protein Mpv17-like isoform X2 [Priapulus caudatus]|uniref:Mitochondrial inner membrane protein Mpv17 n=1 Tax=Priapulus caudatus TaxID=37621 RepID=A0ABM1E5Z2_PRICU|nr:PREDICTED: protein Mpv17-like isoform X2 [Priapulus caudatus]